jgi:hypothetical protein
VSSLLSKFSNLTSISSHLSICNDLAALVASRELMEGESRDDYNQVRERKTY